MPEPPALTDDKPIFDAFVKAGVDSDLAYAATRSIRDGISAAAAARLAAELKAIQRTLGMLVLVLGVLAAMVIGIATMVFADLPSWLRPRQAATEAVTADRPPAGELGAGAE